LQLLLLVFAATIAIQLIYLIIFLVGISRKSIVGQPQSLPVSVIVCAHDEEQNLRELIPLLLQQDYPEFEVVIVDDRSNDTTFDFLLAETAKDHRLRMVHVNRTPAHANGKKYGITLGIKAAKYNWLLFTDADCRPQDNQWIRSMASGFSEDTKFVLGVSPYSRKAGVLNAFIRFETLVTAIQYVAFTLLGKPYMGVGRNLAYRKSVFMDNKGFNDFINVTGGDDDLFVNQHATAQSTVVCLEPSSFVISKPHTTWSAYFRQKLRHLSVGKYYRFGHRVMLGCFALSWLLTWFLAIPLVIESTIMYWAISALVVRLILFSIVVSVSSKRLGQPFEVWAVLPLDFIYAFYYLVTGLVALVSKKIRWKN